MLYQLKQFTLLFGTNLSLIKSPEGSEVTTVKHHQYLEWLKRSIVWTAIMIAFIFRNPSLSNYEISGTLFTLTGSNIQFLLLAAVLFAALFIKRAWCVYLCPISSVEQFVSTLRVWGTESWKKIKV